jgi:hypothetical protein
MSTLTSPCCDTTFNSWLRTNERVFSGPWLAKQDRENGRITWRKLELEISDSARRIGEGPRDLVDFEKASNFTHFKAAEFSETIGMKEWLADILSLMSPMSKAFETSEFLFTDISRQATVKP